LHRFNNLKCDIYWSGDKTSAHTTTRLTSLFVLFGDISNSVLSAVNLQHNFLYPTAAELLCATSAWPQLLQTGDLKWRLQSNLT